MTASTSRMCAAKERELIEAVEELLTIVRAAGVRAEIYHLKAAGKENWGKLDRVIEMVNKARAEGLGDYRRCVHLSGRIDGAHCIAAAVGTRRRVRCGAQAAAGSSLANGALHGRCERAVTTGRTCISKPDLPTASCWWASRTRS